MKNFNEIYENVYKESAKPLEEAREKAVKGISFFAVIAIGIGLLLSILIKSPIFVFLTFVITIFYVAFSKSNRNYTNMFKEKVIRTFVKEYNTDLEYIPNSGISSNDYINGEFESHFDRYHSEDLIEGILEGGYKIRMAEVHTEDEDTDKDGDTSYTTIFHGLYAIVNLDKTVNTDMRVRRNSISLFGIR